jgi:hypothetical protein
MTGDGTLRSVMGCIHHPEQVMKLSNTAGLVAVAFAVGGLAACKSENQAQRDSAAGAVATRDAMLPDTAKHDTTVAPLQITDVKVGKAVDTDKKITDETDDFLPHDTVFVSVHTTGAGNGAAIGTRFNFEDGKVVSDKNETISPATDAYTEFHLAKTSGLKLGKYTLHVTLNGQEIQSKDFTVKNKK